jgi:DNA-directed RNA polymerase specialized sigma24 family protein
MEPNPSTAKAASADLNQERFDRLMEWLNPDREIAGRKYEAIRDRLVQIFIHRGSRTAEELADATIDRVARKLPEISASYTGDPANYFYGVARFIIRESQKKVKSPAVDPSAETPPPAPDWDDERDCGYLHRSLDDLSAEDRYLIAAYYVFEEFEYRQHLADEFGIGMNALRVRAARIRRKLKDSLKELRDQGAAQQKRADG